MSLIPINQSYLINDKLQTNLQNLAVNLKSDLLKRDPLSQKGYNRSDKGSNVKQSIH